MASSSAFALEVAASASAMRARLSLSSSKLFFLLRTNMRSLAAVAKGDSSKMYRPPSQMEHEPFSWRRRNFHCMAPEERSSNPWRFHSAWLSAVLSWDRWASSARSRPPKMVRSDASCDVSFRSITFCSFSIASSGVDAPISKPGSKREAWMWIP